MGDLTNLGLFLDEAWQLIQRGVADRRSASRHPTLATVSRDGHPEARTVVLRGASQTRAELEIHTDTSSAKLDSLTQNPRAAVHIWDPRARLQIRATAHVHILTGPDAAPRWENVPEAGRVSYGTHPPPGSAIDTAFDYQIAPSPARFAVLICDLESLDLLHLGDAHRRAQYLRVEGWRGTWRAP